MKKKILHIIESTATGTLSAMRGLVNSQSDEGNQVTIIYSKRFDTPENLNEYFNANVNLINIQMSSAFNVLTSFFKIYKYIISFNPNYVFLASSWAGFIGRIAGLFVRKKILFFYIPHCISYIRKDIGYLKKFFFILLELIASLKKCVIIACSKSELKQIRKYIKSSPSYLVENAVENDFLKLQQPENKNIKSIITVGSIRAQKDPKNFAKIAKKVLEQDKDISFTWVGDGDEQFKKDLIQSGVNITGMLNKVDVKNKLLNSTLYVSTALWEAMPISILEALASGLPVIAYNCPGNADIIKDKDIGFIFNNNNEAEEMILKLINNKKEIDRMSLKAINIVNTWFNFERYNKDVKDIIKETEDSN